MTTSDKTLESTEKIANVEKKAECVELDDDIHMIDGYQIHGDATAYAIIKNYLKKTPTPCPNSRFSRFNTAFECISISYYESALRKVEKVNEKILLCIGTNELV